MFDKSYYKIVFVTSYKTNENGWSPQVNSFQFNKNYVKLPETHHTKINQMLARLNNRNCILNHNVKTENFFTVTKHWAIFC